MDWSDPRARYELVESVGIEEYNRLLQENLEASVVAVVNGYKIRTVDTRFGKLYDLAGTGTAYPTLGRAIEEAQVLPRGSLPTH